MSTCNKIYKLLFITLLLAVYAAFFSVQFFFNFEAFSGTGVFSKLPAAADTYNKGAASCVKKSSDHSPSRIFFRLNKRFQQENMPPCGQLNIPAPIEYVTINILAYYSEPFLPSVIPNSTLLRGPPFAA